MGYLLFTIYRHIPEVIPKVMYITNGEIKFFTDGPECGQSVHVGKNDNKMISGFLLFSFLLRGRRITREK